MLGARFDIAFQELMNGNFKPNAVSSAVTSAATSAVTSIAPEHVEL